MEDQRIRCSTLTEDVRLLTLLNRDIWNSRFILVNHSVISSAVRENSVRSYNLVVWISRLIFEVYVLAGLMAACKMDILPRLQCNVCEF